MAEMPKVVSTGRVNLSAIRQEVLDKIREQVIGELYSSGGVSYDRAALELLYYLPTGFRDAYIRMFHEAMDGTDGGLGARGEAGAQTAALGRAPGKAAGKRAKTRGTFPVRDEQVLELKDKVDKRLRTISRDILFGLEEIRSTQIGEVTSADKMAARQQLDGDIRAREEGGKGRKTCGKCYKFLAEDWAFCARCGNKV